MAKDKIRHDYKKELNEAGLRATPVRIAVMEFLENTDTPVDVQMIKEYLKQKNVSSDTVTIFRIMNIFTEKCITRKISFNEGKFRYELASREDHHHLICKNCDKVEDLSDCAIPALEKNIQKKKKFQVLSHALEFYGLCQDCHIIPD